MLSDISHFFPCPLSTIFVLFSGQCSHFLFVSLSLSFIFIWSFYTNLRWFFFIRSSLNETHSSWILFLFPLGFSIRFGWGRALRYRVGCTWEWMNHFSFWLFPDKRTNALLFAIENLSPIYISHSQLPAKSVWFLIELLSPATLCAK